MAGCLTATPLCRQSAQSPSATLASSRPAALISHRRLCPSAARQRFVARAEAEAAPAAELPPEKSGNNFTALKDIEAIKKVLPHR